MQVLLKKPYFYLTMIGMMLATIASNGVYSAVVPHLQDRGLSAAYAAQLLRLLLENTNLVVPRETILQVVWGTAISVERRTVDMHIRTLRIKLGDAWRYICTVRMVGYKLTDEEEAGEE